MRVLVRADIRLDNSIAYNDIHRCGTSQGEYELRRFVVRASESVGVSIDCCVTTITSNAVLRHRGVQPEKLGVTQL